MSSIRDVRLLQVQRRASEVRFAGERLDGVRRIVVARDDRLGDVVLSLPAVDALRRTYPEARLALMLRRPLHPLGSMVLGADDLLDAPSDLSSSIRLLRDYETDLLVCISRGGLLPWAAALAGVRYRVGTGYRLYSALLSHRVNERRRAGEHHELEYALSFAHRVGASPAIERFPLQVPDSARASADRWLAKSGLRDSYVLIHPGTGGSCPAWPVEHFLRLAAQVAAGGRPVVLSVGPADDAVRLALDRAPAPVRALPRTSAGIQELAALIQRAAVVVSNSTGPLHLAAALGVVTLGFYVPWATCGVSRWGPYAENGWALVADHEEARGWSRSRRRRDGAALLASIPVDLAAETLERLVPAGS